MKDAQIGNNNDTVDMKVKSVVTNDFCTESEKFPFIPLHIRLREKRLKLKVYTLMIAHLYFISCSNFFDNETFLKKVWIWAPYKVKIVLDW
jgi:hypothetical protein